jgi:hypothetical protein
MTLSELNESTADIHCAILIAVCNYLCNWNIEMEEESLNILLVGAWNKLKIEIKISTNKKCSTKMI